MRPKPFCLALEINSGIQTLPCARLGPVLLKRRGGDLEVSTGIHNVSYLSLFVLSFAPQGLCFTCARQAKTRNSASRLAPKVPLSIVSSRICKWQMLPPSQEPAAVRGNLSPKPKVAVQNCRFWPSRSLLPAPGLDSLFFSHSLSHSEAKHFHFFSSP